MHYNRVYEDNNFVPPTTNTVELCRFAAELKYEDLPAEVVERAKMLLMQTIGTAMTAKTSPIAEKVRKLSLAANGGEGGACTAWITGEKMASANAAMVAGTLADINGWEDCCWTGHASAGVIPVAWAIAEEQHRSGKELICAIVEAYEVYQRIALAVQPGPEDLQNKGWGPTSWQIFATTMAAAKLYDFDGRKMEQSIGIAVEDSTIPTCYAKVTMSEFVHYEYGYRCRDGILCAKAVEKGVFNARDTLDCPECYFEPMTTNPQLGWLTYGLGTEWMILNCIQTSGMSREQYMERFAVQASSVLGNKTAKAVEAICSIEECEDIAELAWVVTQA